MKEFVVVHIYHPNKDLVYFLKKDRPNMPHLHNKWVGFGGGVEDYDKDLFDTAIREIKEEIGIGLDREQLKYRGYLKDSKVNHLVHIFTAEYKDELEEGYIEGEGYAEYKSISHFKNNPKEYPWGNLKYMEKLFFSDEDIKIIV